MLATEPLYFESDFFASASPRFLADDAAQSTPAMTYAPSLSMYKGHAKKAAHIGHGAASVRAEDLDGDDVSVFGDAEGGAGAGTGNVTVRRGAQDA